MRELRVAEQRYQAVLAVISDGLSICQVASKVGVSRQRLHTDRMLGCSRGALVQPAVWGG
jgi:transposase-like protein